MPNQKSTGAAPVPGRHRPLRAPIACLGFLLSLAACEALAPVSPAPQAAVRITPPARYLEWWHKTEACSGLRGNVAQVEWFVVPNASEFPTSDGEKVGLWTHSSTGTRIVIAGNFTESELVVRHEMLHALLDREGHPSEYFEAKCRLTWDSWDARAN